MSVGDAGNSTISYSRSPLITSCRQIKSATFIDFYRQTPAPHANPRTQITLACDKHTHTAHTHKRVPTNTQTHTYGDTHTHLHTLMRTYTLYTHTHTHTHTHPTRTHRHTHTLSPGLLIPPTTLTYYLSIFLSLVLRPVLPALKHDMSRGNALPPGRG